MLGNDKTPSAAICSNLSSVNQSESVRLENQLRGWFLLDNKTIRYIGQMPTSYDAFINANVNSLQAPGAAVSSSPSVQGSRGPAPTFKSFDENSFGEYDFFGGPKASVGIDIKKTKTLRKRLSASATSLGHHRGVAASRLTGSSKSAIKPTIDGRGVYPMLLSDQVEDAASQYNR